jgi:thiol:disulfide interchange protein
MKKLGLLLLFIVSFVGASAQGVKHPVKWTGKVEKKSATEYVLVFDAVIENEWHMYSQFTPDGGSLPLEVTFNNAKGNYTLVGKTQESKTEKQFNETFGVDELFWSHSAQLRQTVKLTPESNKVVQVQLDYQVCKQSCIQDTNMFEFDLAALKAKEVNDFRKIPLVAVTATTTPEATQPTEVAVNDTAATVVADTATAQTEKPAASESKTAPAKEKKDKDEKSPLSIFLLTLLAGIGVTFTPCVFPMIPMTVSFFIKQNSSKSKGKFNAVFYGLCIIGIYVLLSVPFHLFEGIDKNMFADISANVYLNIFFFIIFVVFAISFFGAFEITIPNSWASKADNASNLGGLVGIFFMALTLIIVSFSCTGPALSFVFGSVFSSDGGAILLTLGMFGFGLGLSLPFMLFALFPSLMGSLPKSGGWLNTVKVVFGFVELALAFKFLSNADLVLQLHWLEREVFLAIWIAIFAALTLYLFGKFTTPHDSPVPFLSVGRMLLGALSLTFTIYLIPGLWGAPLKLISGITPPINYSESPFGFGGSGTGVQSSAEKLPEGAASTVHGIIAFEDYDKALAYAKSVNKPLMLDFTGRVCTNCRRMEDNVWVDPRVLDILKNKVVLVSLYGDVNDPLPENEQFVSKYTGRKITTVGKKWNDFQMGKYESNERPLYVLEGKNGVKLNEPVGYTPNIEEYLAWLNEGIAAYK